MEMRKRLLEIGEKVIRYRMAKKSAEACSSVLWKVELANDKIGYLAEISKQSTESVA